MDCINRFSGAALLACATGTVLAGTFSSNFDSGTAAPAGTTLNGSAVIESTGGVNNSGVLKVTKAINGQSGSFVISDLDGAAEVYGFDLTAKVRVGGGTGTPADGFSINFDPNGIPESTTSEEGTGSGITFAFDIFDNGAETPPAPSIDLKVNGQVIATHKMSVADFDTGAELVDLHARVAPDGAASLSYKGQTIFTNVYFTSYQPITGGSFIIGGRTGGLNENQWFDDLNITTFTQPQVGLSEQPQSQTVLAGSDITLNAAANNAESATFQWFRNGTAIAGATGSSLVLPAVTLGQSGEKYTVQVTGANNSVTSAEATLTVKALDLPATPAVSFDFNDGATPANTLIGGGAFIAGSGGVSDSGVLQITTDAPSQSGSLVVEDLAAGAPVYGVTVEFDVLLNSSATPADGFSVSFGNDIEDDPTLAPVRDLENGVGSGLAVAFDLYDNGGGEAPAIDVLYNGQTLASKKLPITELTSADYAHTIINLADDGTVSVVFKGQIIHDKVTVPGFSSVTAGRVAFAGRTGGSSANQFIDNLEITPDTTVGAVRIAAQPVPEAVLPGKTATFSVLANDPAATYQWFRNGTAISGATSSSFTTPAAAGSDDGARYKVEVTKAGSTVASSEVRLTVVPLASPNAPDLSLDFTSGTAPAGTHLYGSGTGIDENTWTARIDGGVLQLTEAQNSEQGAFLIDPLLGGAEISALNVAFDLLIGGGSATPADGFSFNFASDLPTNSVATAEDGVGTGLSLGFDIYDNGNETPPAPSVDLRYKGALLASHHFTAAEIQTGDTFKTVLLSVAPDGTINVSWGDQVLFANVKPTNYTFTANGKFGFYARTGGFNANQWVDNIKIQATKSTAPLRITEDPADVTVLGGQTASLTVAVSDPNGASFQWLRDGAPITGATGATLTTSALTAADNGARFSVRVTGPGGTVTSREAVVTVAAPITISNPKFALNFDDGTYPENVTLVGTANIPDGTLHLTDAVNGQGGAIVITNIESGPVSGFTFHAKVLIGGGTAPPADGLSFVWGNDVPFETAFGEDGAGNGLVLSFDIYDNLNEIPPAPSIDARWNGVLVGTIHLPYQEIETGADFADLWVRVESDGTLDVQYKGKVLFNNVALPGFTPLTDAAFGIGARTGGLNDNQWVDDIQIATSTGGSPVRLTISSSASGTLTVSWTGAGTLEATDALGAAANWAPVTGAANPFTVPNDRKARFFRIVQ